MSYSLTAIASTYLKHCSPDKAYEWLFQNMKWPEYFLIGGPSWDNLDGYSIDREPVEGLLLNREEPLIDLGLAQYGSHNILGEIFARGDSGIRCAVLSNPYLFSGFESAIEISKIIEEQNLPELDSLARNSHLPYKVFKNLISRTDYFASLSDDNYRGMIWILATENKRLDFEMNNMDDYYSCVYFSQVFDAAWQLIFTFPQEHPWIYCLAELLRKIPRSWENEDEVMRAIEKWRLPICDNEEDEGFYVRRTLADLLKADERLLNSSDLALRCSFYTRFSPNEFEDWPKFLNKDGRDFSTWVIYNNNLWSSNVERKKLRDVVGFETFEARQKHKRKESPHWFCDENSNG